MRKIELVENRKERQKKREENRARVSLGARPQAENGGMIGDQSSFHPADRVHVGDEV